MSTFRVPITKILDVKKHPNADKLDIVKVYGFEIITQKDQYKVDDIVLFIPPDSILPQNIENILFGPDSKIKLNKHRVKQIKIRGSYSQGMVANPKDIEIGLGIYLDNDLERYTASLENDYSEKLGITKYEPPLPDYQSNQPKVKKERNKQYENPYFHKYNGLENIKWYPDLFTDGELVSITEKLHGTSFRAGYVPYTANSLLKRILKFFKLSPKYEFVWGSNNVQLQEKYKDWTGYYEEDVYTKIVKQYDLKNRLKDSEVIYGEIIGDKIQKNYTYGCKEGEHKLVLFDVKIQTKDASDYLNVDDFQAFCKERGFEYVPELYRGPFNLMKAKELTIGDSVYCASQKVREGVVIKSLVETTCSIGKKALKLISEKYLEGDQTDYH